MREQGFQRNPKKIVKNTTFLYIRMLILMVISLYTSRLVLKELGITDYGIYNVIGGLITIFSFINGSMAQASQRFITFEVGTGNLDSLKKIFSTCVYIHFFLAGVIVFLGETIGLWYVYNVAVIPADRFTAALWIYQCSIVVSCATIITVPYNALIIAHERMSAFAYLTILEASLKLGIAFLLVIMSFDRLIGYGILMGLLSVIMRFIYGIYSRRVFPEAHLSWQFDKTYVRKIGSFVGWSLWGSVAAAGYSQGLNLLINFFFSPAINAARGIAVTVQSVVRNFSNNFQVAVNPQITKSYASNDIEYMHSLIYRASLFSFFLFFLVALPVFLEIDTLLSLWLVETPEYTNIFIRILLAISSIELLASPLNVSAQATGDIKKYEITISIILLLIVPIAYFVLRLNPVPENVFWVFLFQVCIAQVARILLMKNKIGLSLHKYIRCVIFRIISVCTISSIIPLYLHYRIEGEILRLILVSVGCASFTPVLIFFLGLDKKERESIVSALKHRFGKCSKQGIG